MSKRLFIIATVVAWLGFGVLGAYAQENPTGTIQGQVTDPQKAAVPGANVTVLFSARGTQFTTQTDGQGKYSVTELQPGAYEVKIGHPGFTTYDAKAVEVVVGQTYTLNAELKLGVESTVTEIMAGAQVLQVAQTSVQHEVSGTQVTQIPITSRNGQDLAIFLPDLQTTSTPRASSFDGLPPGALNITFDGINSQDEINKSTSSSSFFSVSQPRIDDVDEFNVTTSAGDATQTGEGAVQLAIVSKKGTNQWHGGGWWYKRNGGWNANNFFTNQKGLARQVIQLNEFGYKIGGPILANKLFFFTDWDQWENPSSLTRTRTVGATGAIKGVADQTGNAVGGFFTYKASPVPTLAQLSTTSNFITCNTTGVQANECSVNLLGANGYVAQGLGFSGSTVTEDPYVASLVTSISQATLQSAGVTIQNAGSLNSESASYNVAVGSHRRYPDLRMDYNINKSNSLEYDLHYAYYDDTPDTLNNADPEFPVAPYNTAYGAQTSNRTLMVLAWRYTVSPSMTNELRIGTEVDPVGFFQGENPTIYPSVNSNIGSIRVLPSYPSVLGTNPFLGFNVQADSGNLFQGNETLTWTKGNHNFSIGGSLSHVMYSIRYSNFAVGSLSSGASTQDPVIQAAGAFSSCTVVPTTANPNPTAANTCALVNDTTGSTDVATIEGMWANMVGRISSFSDSVAVNLATQQFQAGAPELEALHQNETSLFFQDNFRFRPTITVNYGLRWEWQGAITDPLNEFYSFNSQPANGLSSIWGVSGVNNFYQPGVMNGNIANTVATVNNGAPYWDPFKKAFAPSLGVAWTPSDIGPEWLRPLFGHGGQTVFRAGYSFAFDREGVGTLEGGTPLIGGTNTASYKANAPAQATAGSGIFAAGTIMQSQIFSGTGAALTNSPLTGTVFAQPGYGTPIPLSVNGNGNNFTNVFSPNFRPASVQSWNLAIQRQINRDTSIEIRYVGNHSTGLPVLLNYNQLNTQTNGWLNEFTNAQVNYNTNHVNLGPVGVKGTGPNGCTGSGLTGAGLVECQDFIIVPSPSTNKLTPIDSFADLQIGNDTYLPIITSSFSGVNSLSGTVSNSANSNQTGLTTQSNLLFENSTFINDLKLGESGSMASSLNNLTDWENLSGCANNATGQITGCTDANGYAQNFWEANPESVGGALDYTNIGQSTYNSLQVELRRRMHNGMQFDANYSYSKTLGYEGAPSDLRNLRFNEAPQGSDLRNVFKFENLTEIPLGEGHMLKTGNGFVDRNIIGGWEWDGILRWQSGDSFTMTGGLGGTVFAGDGGVQFAPGLTQEAVQASLGTDVLGSNPASGALPGIVEYVPASLQGTKRSEANFAAMQGCETAGTWCAKPYYYGPNFFKADWGLLKTAKLTEKVSMTVRANFLDIFNNINFSAPSSTSLQSTTFGNITGDYSDFTSTQDPGGRVIEGQLRFNF